MTRIRTARDHADGKLACMMLEDLPQPKTKGPVLPSVKPIFWKSNLSLDQSGSFWIPACLPILMRCGSDGVFLDPQDALLTKNASTIQEIYHGWWPWMKRVHLRSEVASPTVSAEGVGCFFSGGVDSFYSTLEHIDEITHLVFVKSGFDIFPPNPELSERTFRAMAAAAAAYGKPLVTIETNVREVSSRYVRWGQRYHGAALATVGHLLREHIGTAIIPSSYQAEELEPWGSHPDVDPLWSSSCVQIVHDSVRPSRADKVKRLCDDPVAMTHLRVCWRNPNSAYNCGKCEKCVRTMISLYAFDALGRCSTFESNIDLDRLSQLDVRFGHLPYAIGNVALLRETKGRKDPVYMTLKKRVEIAEASASANLQ